MTRGSLALLLAAALFSGTAGSITFVLRMQDLESQFAALVARNARLLDIRLRALAGVTVHEAGSVPARGAPDPLQIPFASLAQDLDAAEFGQVRFMLLTGANGQVTELPPTGGMAASPIAMEYSGAACSAVPRRVALIGRQLVSCAALPAVGWNLLAVVNPLAVRRPALGAALLVFLCATALFVAGVGFALIMPGMREIDQASLRNALRQVIARRRDAIELLRQESDTHSDARRISTYGRWSTRLIHGEYFWFEADEEVARIYGIAREVLLGSSADVLHSIHPDDTARVGAEYRRVNREQRRYSLQYRLVQPGGSVREVLEVGEPLLGAAGQLLGYHGIVQDFTGRQARIDPRHWRGGLPVAFH